MSEWKKVKLKDVLTEVSERNKGEKINKVLSVTNSQGFVSQEEYFEGTVHSENISNYKIIRKDQFAYNPSRVNVGSIDILKNYEEGALSPMYVIFETDKNKLLPEYFKYYFQTHEFFENVKNNTQGSVRHSLSFKSLADFEYLLPPLEEQKKIVKILKNVDLIIENIKLEIEKIEILKKWTLNNLLKKYKNKVVKLKDIVNFKKGFAFKSKEYKESGIRIIRVSDLGKNGINDDCEKIFIAEKNKRIYKEYELKEKDIIVTTVGSKPPIYASIAGRTIIVDKKHEGTLLNQNTVRLRVDDLESSLLIFNQLNGKRYLDYLSLIMRGNANQGNITIDELLDYEIIIVNEKNKNEIENVLKIYSKKLNFMEKKVFNYANLKKGLMQQLLTGKVEINV